MYFDRFFFLSFKYVFITQFHISEFLSSIIFYLFLERQYYDLFTLIELREVNNYQSFTLDFVRFYFCYSVRLTDYGGAAEELSRISFRLIPALTSH